MAAGDETIAYLNAIVLQMLEAVDKSDLTTPGAEAALLQNIYGLLDQFGLVVKDVLAPEVLMAYFGGVDEATALIQDAGAEVEPTLAMTPEGLISKPFQKVVHVKAVEEVIDDTMMDMSAAINTAKLSASTTITETLAAVKQDIASGLIKGDARKTTQAKVSKTFRDQGMTSFVTAPDVNGRTRNLPLNFYAMTVVRTKTREATVQGSINRYNDSGSVKLVKINGNGDSCEICSRYNQLVVSIGSKKFAGFPGIGDEHVRLPPFHPNCRCSIRPYLLNFEDKDVIEADKLRAKEFKKNPLKDRRTEEQRAAYDKEQRLRRIANEEVKQYMRWQALLGADAPKTIGAFRAMKRKGSPKFLELQSLVRSQAGLGKTLQGAEYKAKPKLNNALTNPVTGKPLSEALLPPVPDVPKGISSLKNKVTVNGSLSPEQEDRLTQTILRMRETSEFEESLGDSFEFVVDDLGGGEEPEFGKIVGGVIHINKAALDVPYRNITYEMVREMNFYKVTENGDPTGIPNVGIMMYEGQTYYDHVSLLHDKVASVMIQQDSFKALDAFNQFSDGDKKAALNYFSKNVSALAGKHQTDAIAQSYALYKKDGYVPGFLPKELEDYFFEMETNMKLAPVPKAKVASKVAVPKPKAAVPKPKAKPKADTYTKESALEKYPYPTDGSPTPYEQIMDPVKWAKKQDKLAAAAKPKKVQSAALAEKTPLPGKDANIATDEKALFKLLKKGRGMETDTIRGVQKLLAGKPKLQSSLEMLGSYRDAWMDSSVGGKASALQDYLSEKYGFGYKPLMNENEKAYYKIIPELDAAFEAQMKYYQDKLRAAGHTHIRIYRGVGVSIMHDKKPDWLPTEPDENGNFSLNADENGRALTSWSFSEDAAVKFTRGNSRTTVMVADIPIEKVWAAFGLGNEAEIVPLGRIDNIRYIRTTPEMQKLMDQ